MDGESNTEAGAVIGPFRYPFFSVWIWPQATLRQILASRDRYIIPLMLAYSAAVAPLLMAMAYSGGAITWDAAIFYLALSAVVSPIVIWVQAALVIVLGRAIGGAGRIRDMVAAVVWALPPVIVAALGAWLIVAVAPGFGAIAGSDGSPEALAAIALATILAVWSLFILVRLTGAAHRFGVWRSVTALVAAFVALEIVTGAVRALAFQPFHIPAGSMAPALIPGDYLFAKKFSYGYGQYSSPLGVPATGRVFGAEPQRGDIIIFRSAKDPGTDYVKRIVGLPGETIQIKGGVLHINAVAVKLEPMEDYAGEGAAIKQFRETLPNGVSYPVLDMISESRGDDTKAFSVPPASYFVLGDNCDNSADSRYSNLGFVPYDNLIGKVSTIFFSSSAPNDGAQAEVRWGRMFRSPQ
ncbi:MAG: signal peptidase I [Hyphomicrobiales bacterium]|nr:signal peptidase I [Hyphomicrobiales bacterium]